MTPADATISRWWRDLHDSLVRIFEVLRVAIARSSWARLQVFCRRDSFGRKRRRLNGVRTRCPAPW